MPDMKRLWRTNLAIQIVRLYPADWRARYSEEMRSVLDEHEVTFGTCFDLFGGAVDARVRLRYRGAGGLSAMERQNRLRISLATVFFALALSSLSWFVLIVDQYDLAWDALSRTNVLISASNAVMLLTYMLPWLIMLLTGPLLLGALVAQAKSTGRPTVTPLQALLLSYPLVGVLLATLAVLYGPSFPVGIVLLLIASILASPAGVALAVGSSQFDEGTLRLAFIPAVAVTLCLFAHSVAAILCQAVTSSLWPGGNWSPELVTGIAISSAAVLPAAWAVLRSWSVIASGPTSATPITE